MDQKYVYIRSEPGLWTVGFYHPDGAWWEAESDHGSPEEAAARVAYLNGDDPLAALVKRVEDLERESRAIRSRVAGLAGGPDA